MRLMRLARLSVVAVFVCAAAIAHAHVGAQVSNAAFTSPAGPTVMPGDNSVTVAPGFAVATADASFHLEWMDGDTDPTGRFFFYYLDHEPSFQVLPSDLENIATPIKGLAGDGGVITDVPVAVWAGCTCVSDGGIMCPDAGVRYCPNDFTWDTSGVAEGVYWVVAINNDPPYHVYSVGPGPVRVAHAAASPPPAAIVLRPDGFGSADDTYRVQWLAQGKEPLTFDLAYGLDEQGAVLGPVTSLGNNVTPIKNADGTYSWDWDVHGLDSLKVYFLRVTVHDADGKQSYTDSRLGLSIYHPGPDMTTAPTDGGVPVDMAVTPMKQKSGCEMSAAQTAAPFVPLVLLALIYGGMSLARRRRP